MLTRFKALILILAISGALSVPALADNPIALSYPALFFSYSPLYDSLCPSTADYKIDPSWAAEADKRAPEFQATWASTAPILLGDVLSYFKKGFSRHEMTATLSVCNTGSMSNPLIVNIRPQLVSFMNPEPVRPVYAFTDSVFHELLHTFVVENLPDNTPLLTKYAKENPLVLSHLHLFAIEKLVYTRLGRADDLKWLDYLNHRIGGDYERAWDIVDQIENYESFIAEFSLPSGPAAKMNSVLRPRLAEPVAP